MPGANPVDNEFFDKAPDLESKFTAWYDQKMS